MSNPDVVPHQTVGWLIELLKEYNPSLPVVFSTGTDESVVHLLSDYTIHEDSVLCIDIGDESDV